MAVDALEGTDLNAGVEGGSLLPDECCWMCDASTRFTGQVGHERPHVTHAELRCRFELALQVDVDSIEQLLLFRTSHAKERIQDSLNTSGLVNGLPKKAKTTKQPGVT